MVKMLSSQNNIKNEFFKFGETVSVKGVSRIIKAKNKLFRALWLVAVVTSLCILLWQLSTVFMKYFRWPVDTVIEESDGRPLFPDVTFCNTYPTKAYEIFGEKMNWGDFLTVTEQQLYEFWFRANLTDNDYTKLVSYFLSKTAYISNFPVFDSNFSFEDGLILDHEFYSWHWREVKSNCQKASVQLRWNPNYIVCRTIHVSDECQSQIRGEAVILYLENFPEWLQLGFRSGLSLSEATGVVFAIHAPGTEPDLRTLHSIGPGTETGIRLSPIIRSRLPSPYGDCTSQKYIEEAADSNDEKLLYTKDLCFEICFQQRVVEACGCLSTAFPFTPHQKMQTNGTVCGNLSMLDNASTALIMEGFEDYLCTMKTELDLDDCEYKCKSQCEEVKYDMTVTTAPWPHISSQLALSNVLVANPLFKSKFDIYLKIKEQFLTYRNDTETIRMLEGLDLIERNFLQVNIFFDSYSSLVLKDVPSLTADKMMGLIGGGLSLWLGVTIMTLVEIVEFFFTLIDIYFSKKKVSNQNQPNKVAVVAIG